jgi:SPP1 family predicted phage head-tail adaptor
MNIPRRFSTNTQYKTASDFNCRIDFAQASGAETDGTLNTAVVVKSGVWASVAMWRGKEQDKAQQRNATSSFKITIRYDKNFVPTSDMVIQYHGQTYNIESVSDIDGQRVQLEIWAWIENDGLNA